MFGFGKYSTQIPKPPAMSKKGLTEGDVKSQIKLGNEKTQAPPPPKPPKVMGEWQVNNKTKPLFPEAIQRAKDIVENSNIKTLIDQTSPLEKSNKEWLDDYAKKIQDKKEDSTNNFPDFKHIPPPPQKEMVNGPQHYGGVDNPYEVIKVCEAWGLDKDAYLFNVVKYVARAGKKDPKKELEDLKKAIFYLQRKVENLQK